MSVLTRLYPRATHGKYKLGQRGFNNGWLFLRAAAKNFLLLQLLFLGLFAYVFGSLFQQTDHTHNLTIAFVDYDGPGNGAIGAAVRQAYGSLRGPSFPTLEEQAAGSFPTAADLQLAVCGTRFWGALYVMAGASGRLHDALTAPAPAAGAYDRTDAVGFIWNEARYSTVVDSAVEANVQLLSQAARAAYISGGSGSGNGTGTGGLTAVSGVAALAVLAEPWELRTTDIQPTTQGSRAIYNTLVIILILIQEFFYLGTINGLYAAFEMYQRVHPARIVFVRVLNSLTYCLVGSLCTAGAIWAFRAGWDVDGAQFGLTWMVLWLFAHVNFVTLDSFTSWLPGPYVPMALIAWVVANVTSILLPFELSPGFYRVGYAIPAHEVYQALVHIWSRGCNPQLAVALPVLFAWELAGLLATALGAYRKAHYATLAAEKQAAQFNERVDAALEFERQRDKESRDATATAATTATTVDQSHGDGQTAQPATPPPATDAGTVAVRKELAGVIMREDSKAHRAQRLASRACNFGPAFELPFGERDASSSSLDTEE